MAFSSTVLTSVSMKRLTHMVSACSREKVQRLGAVPSCLLNSGTAFRRMTFDMFWLNYARRQAVVIDNPTLCL